MIRRWPDVRPRFVSPARTASTICASGSVTVTELERERDEARAQYEWYGALMSEAFDRYRSALLAIKAAT